MLIGSSGLFETGRMYMPLSKLIGQQKPLVE